MSLASDEAEPGDRSLQHSSPCPRAPSRTHPITRTGRRSASSSAAIRLETLATADEGAVEKAPGHRYRGGMLTPGFSSSWPSSGSRRNSLFTSGMQKLSWFAQPPLQQRFAEWASHPANAAVAKYLGFVSQYPAVFSRVVPVGELGLGMLLIAGLLTPLAALLAFLMVLNYQFASSQMFSMAYLRGQSGLAYVLIYPVFSSEGGHGARPRRADRARRPQGGVAAGRLARFRDLCRLAAAERSRASAEPQVAFRGEPREQRVGFGAFHHRGGAPRPAARRRRRGGRADGTGRPPCDRRRSRRPSSPGRARRRRGSAPASRRAGGGPRGRGPPMSSPSSRSSAGRQTGGNVSESIRSARASITPASIESGSCLAAAAKSAKAGPS